MVTTISTKVKKRKVMQRDHADIANFIREEQRRRQNSKWRKKHEDRWREVDRQISMEPPHVLDKSDTNTSPGEWHNAIQLGDLTDASETLTADVMRLILPTERKFFTPHVEIKPEIDEQTGDLIPVPREQQKQVNGVLRNLMVQQHKDFGFRGRVKLSLKEILHHGSVVAVVKMERMAKYHDGSRVETLKAPALSVHSMWNAFPDDSPSIQPTELFYRGSMIIRSFVPLKNALEMPNWINKEKLQSQNSKKDMKDHIEILTYYGDIFLKRHDGNILFPNRKTVISGEVFLESTINPTPYSPVIYTGYERDDVRDPYYTSPIVKRAPMGQFATHMANKTMDSVDLKVKPPITYDSLDNAFRGGGPEIYPGAKLPSRGGMNIQTLDVGDPATGLAAMQFAKQSLQEGTTVDPVRKGVSPGTEQTATEVVTTEERAEVREVEFVAGLESEFLLPFLHMQHDMNLKEMETYPFFNDEIHTPDFLRATKKDLPKAVVMEVTGSRFLLREQQRTSRFINTVGIVANLEPVAAQADWQEISRQLWEDTRVKDPERFLRTGDRNEEVQAALQQQQAQFEEIIAQLQQQGQQLQQTAQEAQEAQQRAEAAALKAGVQRDQQRLQQEQVEVQRRTLQEQLKLNREFERAEDQLQRMLDEIKDREAKLACAEAEKKERNDRDERIIGLVEQITTQ